MKTAAEMRAITSPREELTFKELIAELNYHVANSASRGIYNATMRLALPGATKDVGFFRPVSEDTLKDLETLLDAMGYKHKRHYRPTFEVGEEDDPKLLALHISWGDF